MAIQYADGSFSDAMPFAKLMGRFNQDVADGVGVRAIHFGTPAEVEKAKEKQEMAERLSALEQKVKDLTPVKTSLVIPTQEEVRTFGQQSPYKSKLRGKTFLVGW